MLAWWAPAFPNDTVACFRHCLALTEPFGNKAWILSCACSCKWLPPDRTHCGEGGLPCHGKQQWEDAKDAGQGVLLLDRERCEFLRGDNCACMPLPQPGLDFLLMSCCSWSLWRLRKSQIDATRMVPRPNYIPGRRSATFSLKVMLLCDTCYAAKHGGSLFVFYCSLKQ